jgi:hypothetical protein
MDDFTSYCYIMGTLYFCLLAVATDIIFQCSISDIDIVLPASDIILPASDIDIVLPASNIVLPANNIDIGEIMPPSLYLISKCYYQIIASSLIISSMLVIELFYNSADLISGDSIGSVLDMAVESSTEVIAGSSLAAPSLDVSQDSDSLTSIVNLIVEASDPPSNAFVEASDSESPIDMTAYKRLIAVLHS